MSNRRMGWEGRIRHGKIHQVRKRVNRGVWERKEVQPDILGKKREFA